MTMNIELKGFELQENQNVGCNNGEVQEWTALDEFGQEMNGAVCRCWSGCQGTDIIIERDGDYWLVVEDVIEGEIQV